jgi:hypothetical protein
MTQGRYVGPEKRRSPRHDRRFKVALEYEGKTYEIRTINISRHGVMIQRRNPPSVGTHVKLTITISVWIDIISPGYDEFVKDKITIA